MRSRTGIAVAAAAIVVAAACSSGAPQSAVSGQVRDNGAAVVPAQPTYKGLHGDPLPSPVPKPDITLTDTAGHPYNLVQATQGKVVLLYFGYTHCPDVCPTTMADIATALRHVAPSVRSDVAVVFVTVDPARDTPAVLRQWLDQFDAAFVGLTGPPATVEAAQRQVGLAVLSGAEQVVNHSVETLAFTRDNLAHVAYVQSPVSDYVADLPALVGQVSG